MGCNCGSKMASAARAQIVTFTQPVVEQQVVPLDQARIDQAKAMAERIDSRKDLDTTLCSVCRTEVIDRLEFCNNRWVKVKWCQRCNTRIK